METSVDLQKKVTSLVVLCLDLIMCKEVSIQQDKPGFTFKKKIQDISHTKSAITVLKFSLKISWMCCHNQSYIFLRLSLVCPLSALPHCWTDNKFILLYSQTLQRAQSSTQTTKPLSVLSTNRA